MKPFLTEKDFVSIDYIPQNRMAAFVVAVNKIIHDKVAGNDEAAWTEFVDEYVGGTLNKPLDSGTTSVRQ